MPTLTERITTLAERITTLEAQIPLKFDMVNEKLDNIDEFLKDGFTEKIEKVVREEIQKNIPANNNSNNNNKKKNVVLRIWQHEQFWRLAHRGMVIILFMIFLIVCALLGIDITSQKSIILKLLGIG